MNKCHVQTLVLQRRKLAHQESETLDIFMAGGNQLSNLLNVKTGFCVTVYQVTVEYQNLDYLMLSHSRKFHY